MKGGKRENEEEKRGEELQLPHRSSQVHEKARKGQSWQMNLGLGLRVEDKTRRGLASDFFMAIMRGIAEDAAGLHALLLFGWSVEFRQISADILRLRCRCF